MILKETLREMVLLQQEELVLLKTGVPRKLLSEINRTSPHVVVLSGIRRCGKSTLLRQLIQSGSQFYYFNFEDPRAISFEIADFEKLDLIFREEFGEGGDYFFDEIQNVPEWERFVRKLQDRRKKVFITGSNASLLSRELGTRLTGRHLSYELYPFSFNEMLKLTNDSPSSGSFMDYCSRGGFPEFLKYDDMDILRQLFSDIITRDVITRHRIREHRVLQELAIYLLTNSGNEFSFNRLRRQFELGSTNTAISYVSYLKDTYLLFTIPRFDYSYSKQRTNPKKVYAIDPGLTRVITASLSTDHGRVLENIVYLHLRRRHKEIYYHKKDYECDFLVKSGPSVSQAVQVCYELTEDNIKRELSGLREAMEITGTTSGAILTFDQEDRIEDIPVRPVWQWCLEQDV